MFSSIFNNVVEKLSGLNPIKTFIKYALDKFLNELINNQIRLEDFKNGCLNLASIGFNVDNVNMKHLISSPYIMHSGSIGNLKIQLPNLAEVVAKSIQIEVSQILIQLKPNKDFYKNFKERMKQLQENSLFDIDQSLPEEELSENNPMDFFKETLKKILLNIKIKVENIVVKVYMSNPQDTDKRNPYYLMMRIPTINVHKNNGVKSIQNKNAEQIKLDIEMPQFTIHLMNERTKMPEFSNEKFNKEDFPFNYPTVNHPSTILLFGLNEFKGLNIETDPSIPRLTVSVITDNKKAKRDLKIEAVTSKIQFMVDPLQLKILSRFIHQIKQFKDILSFVKNEFLQGHYNSIEMPVSKKSKNSESKHEDVFSSICMSVWEKQTAIRPKKTGSIIDAVVKESPELEKSINKYNSEFQNQLAQKNVLKEISQQITSELRVVNFEKRMQINLEVSQVYIYVMKQVAQKAYYRKWMEGNQEQKINQAIPGSYFMFSLERMKFNLQEKQKLINIEVSKLKLENIKLFRNPNVMSFFSEQEFVDVQGSSCFYSVNEESFTIGNTISEFKPLKGNHYCVQEIARISQKPSENYQSEKLKKYNFLPKPQQQEEISGSIHKPGFKFSVNDRKPAPVMKIQILEVVVSLNPQMIREVLDIYFPIQEFQRLSQTIAADEFIQSKQLETVEKTQKMTYKKRTLLESQYNFGNQYVAVQQFIQKKQKPLIQLHIQEINLGFYESPIEHFTNLVDKQKNNEPHRQTPCFCQLNRKGLYFQTYNIQLQAKNQNISIAIKRIVTGQIQLKNSKIAHIKALLNLSSKRQKQRLRIILERDNQTKTQKIFVILPDFDLNIQEKYTLNCIQLIKSQLFIAEQIFFYYHHLKYSMEMIEKSSHNFGKKNRKNQQKYDQTVQLYVQTFHMTVLKAEIYLKHLYLQKFTDQFVFKLSTLVFSIKENVQLFLTVMKNQEMCVRQFIETERRYSSIKDSNIIFEIHDNTYVHQPFQTKYKKAFFERLSKTSGSIMFNISKTSIMDQSHVSSSSRDFVSIKSKFQFTKKPSLKQTNDTLSHTEIIAEEEQHRKIIINISSPVYVFANNIFRLFERKKDFQKFFQQLRNLIHEISLETKVFSKPERKTSTDSDIEKVEEMDIKISAGKINIDIRPTFAQKLLKHKHEKDSNLNIQSHFEKELFFASSRSYLQFEWDNIDIFIQKRIEKSNLKGNFNLKYFFVDHQERQTATNPLFIQEKDLKDLGFIEILSLKNLKFNVDVIKQKTKFNSLEISSLSVQLSLSSVVYLMLHWQHFINHNVKKNFGTTIKQEDQRFQILEQKQNGSFQKISQKQKPASDEQIEDLTNGYEIYQKKMEFKKSSEMSFKAKQYIEIKDEEESHFYVKQFKIKEMKLKLYSGNDFQFVSFDTVNQSQSKKRFRVDDSEILKYIQVRTDLVSISLRMSKEMKTESSIKIENFEINYSDKKEQKNGITKWFNSIRSPTEQVVFPVVRSLNVIKLMLDFNEEVSYFKLSKTAFQIGFTSDILELVNQFNQVKQRIQHAGWKKIYQSQQNRENVEVENRSKKQVPEKTKLILVHIPQNRLNFRLIYKGVTILSNQTINAAEFMLHEESNRSEKMLKIVENWVKKLVLENIGTLISGTTLNVLGDVIGEILKVVKFLLGCIFRPGNSIEQQ